MDAFIWEIQITHWMYLEAIYMNGEEKKPYTVHLEVFLMQGAVK